MSITEADPIIVPSDHFGPPPDTQEIFDPAADFIRERGMEDPQFLGSVSPDLRRYHDWFRTIVLPVAEQHGSQMINIVPEFAADNEVRHAAGNLRLDAKMQQRVDTLMRTYSAANYPKGTFLPGRPIEPPLSVAREEYMDGRIHRGLCSLCGEEETLLGQIQLYSGEFRDRIEAIRVDVGECDVSLLHTSDWQRILDSIYTKGALRHNARR